MKNMLSKLKHLMLLATVTSSPMASAGVDIGSGGGGDFQKFRKWFQAYSPKEGITGAILFRIFSLFSPKLCPFLKV